MYSLYKTLLAGLTVLALAGGKEALAQASPLSHQCTISCMKDGHAFKLVVVPGANVADVNWSNVLSAVPEVRVEFQYSDNPIGRSQQKTDADINAARIGNGQLAYPIGLTESDALEQCMQTGMAKERETGCILATDGAAL
jgi:hypothetical protein